jgi:hypothetical protein
MLLRPASIARRAVPGLASGGYDLICTTEPGEVTVGFFVLKSQAEVEECIDSIRKAAMEAKLPLTSDGDLEK